MIITIKSISVRNFMSYGNNLTTIEFNKIGTTLIVGENLDDTSDGIVGNGTGKTSILNALTYALYDKPISDISKDNLVNNINKKNMEVIVEFAIDDIVYKVKRERKMKSKTSGNNVYFWVNGEDKTLDSVTNTNKLIESIIGIPYELFVRIIIFSATQAPFLDLPKASQTAIFEEINGFTTLSDKADILKEHIKEAEYQLKLKKAKIESLEKEHERHNTLVTNANQRIDNWYTKTTQEINQLSASLDELNNIDLEKEELLHNELTEITSQAVQFNTQALLLEQQWKQLNKELSTIKDQLGHLQQHTCPYCLQQYTKVDKKIDSLSASSVDIENKITLLTTQIANNDEIILDLHSKKIDVAGQITVKNIENLLKTKRQSTDIVSKIEDLKVAINPFIEPFEELNNIELESIDYTEINNLTKEIDHQKFLLKLLTKKDSFLRRALLNKNIPYLNTKLQYYLTALGLPHKVEFTYEMTAKISQFGHSLDFGNLSAGQRARVNLSLSLAFNDLLQYIHKKINICMFDEVLDIGLDSVGVHSAIKLLKKRSLEQNISTYIVSHRDETKGVFDNTITVQMKKGFSYIKELD
ncbi:MAG: AAA family ATPase [Nitrososphaeraceae archaeon]